MTPKQIIIDKDAFVGINLDALCNFAGDHFLILPRVLHDECADNENARETLFGRFRDIILAGGYTCASGRDIVKKEGQSLEPYGLLPDLAETSEWREAFKKGAILSKPDSVDDIHQGHVDAAHIALEENEEVASTIAPKKLEEAEEKRAFFEANKLSKYSSNPLVALYFFCHF